MSQEVDYDAPDRCTVGVIGEVGNRLFLLYCRQGLSETTVKVEKQQVAVLASYLGRIVKELGRPGHLPDDLTFDGAEEPEWVVGTIGVSYDDEIDRVVVVLEEVAVEPVDIVEGDDAGDGDGDGDGDDDEDGIAAALADAYAEEFEDEGHVLRIVLTREQAAGFAIHATLLVEAGRPPCPLCGLPLDPSGHDCPRTNGHRPPVT